ncbi:hypothetical protein U1Q18_041822 [Sarracenia purpurea var. burkii]
MGIEIPPPSPRQSLHILFRIQDILTAPSEYTTGQNEQIDGVLGNNSRGTYPRPSAPEMDDLPAYSNDIEEEMVQAVIEASKREVGEVVKCV